MKILLSAYACEPNKGSEPSVGWHWAIELTKLGHEVWVLTRANNAPVIKSEFQEKQQPDNLHFIYYDLPQWIRCFKRGNRGIYLYYLLWQWGAYKTAKKIHSREQLDLVHHVTFVSVRQPSLMGNLRIPFIFGPVAGGETAPWRLRFHYGLRGFLVDAIRDIANFFVKYDPMMWFTFLQSNKIHVTSEQSKRLIPSCFHPKVKVHLAIALDTQETIKPLIVHKHNCFRVLYIGRFLYWKGMGLGLQAFAKLIEQVPNAQLTMVGKGPYKERLHSLAVKLNIADKIDWIAWMKNTELTELYQHHDVFLFPSLHDSGGMVVLEALAHGLPVICFDLGGPGMIVDNSCGIKIKTKRKSENTIIINLSQALIDLYHDENLLLRLSNGAKKRVSEYSWQQIVLSIYKNG